ncbi:MAG: cupredoxin domain-containing protein [Gammaproteobacteria bacterium]
MCRFLCAVLLAVSIPGLSPQAVAANTPVAAELHGKVSFVRPNDSFSTPDYKDTVIFFKPDAATMVKPLSGDITLTTKNYAFVPHVLTVTVGTKVQFPNQDSIFHNVFSPSVPNNFDLGLYGAGPGKTIVFAHSGLVHVYCNVHHYMFAYILVLDTPYFTNTQADGTFSLSGLPPGPGVITIWNPRTRIFREHVNPIPEDSVSASLTVMESGIPKHLNKLGKPYFQFHGPGM